MNFDKKKIGIGLVCTVALGSAIAYGSLKPKEKKVNEPSSSQVASPIERVKGKEKKDNTIEKSKKKNNEKNVIENLFGEESEASVIDSINDGNRTAINRDPISDIMSDIDKQANMQAEKAKNDLQKDPIIPGENQQEQDRDKNSGEKSDDKKNQGPDIVPQPIDPTPSPVPNPTPEPSPDPDPGPTPGPPIESVNYSGLISILEQASQLVRSTYTPASMSLLDSETRIGYSMLSSQTATQQQVNDQINRIQKAIQNLVAKANKSSLTSTISTALAKDLDQYTPETAEKLTKAIEAAQAVIADDNVSQAAVDLQNSALQSAIDQLIQKADKAELLKVITEAENINREIYVDESLSKLETALAVAKEVKEDPNASQEKVDSAKSELKNAIDTLQEKEEPEKTLVLIKQLIAECEGLVKSEYTPQSYQVLEQEIATSKALVENPNVTSAEATAQLTALETAKNQLVKLADTSKLQAAINEAKALTESDYTSESWSALQTALSGAEMLKEDPNATQAQIDQKESDIRTAISTLEKN